MANRRRFLLAAGVVAVGGAVALRPGDHGGPHGPYFVGLSAALAQAGISVPVMVIDRARMRANAARVVRNINGKMALRLVAKSLPSLPLLDELMQLTRTRRLMVFNQPYLQLLAEQRPDTDLLLGKPMPARAAQAFYAAFKGEAFDPARQLQWLVDTPERLAEYRELARAGRHPLRVNIEIDVGLHRGGVRDDHVLADMLNMIAAEPLLAFGGLMGYDPHLVKIPDLPGARAGAERDAKAIYTRFREMALRTLKPASPEALCFNAAGSPTYRMHDGSGAANEVSVGSAMVKPSDFDTPLLDDLQPASFIATPVLKSGGFLLPDGAEGIGRVATAWDVNQRHGYFIYGGYWLADPVSPPGLSASGLYGNSSNQQVLVGSGTQGLKPNDFIFLRPRQSEAVLQQFGELVVVEEGNTLHRWPVMPAMP
ncbi:alanine racemase [Ralstonia sp. 24A2]|uniref:alanine racemase n=1 Tax=Ralstonia sp. 24A2 TaxID=3447364 RepID=UPI003F6A3954